MYKRKRKPNPRYQDDLEPKTRKSPRKSTRKKTNPNTDAGKEPQPKTHPNNPSGKAPTEVVIQESSGDTTQPKATEGQLQDEGVIIPDQVSELGNQLGKIVTNAITAYFSKASGALSLAGTNQAPLPKPPADPSVDLNINGALSLAGTGKDPSKSPIDSTVDQHITGALSLAGTEKVPTEKSSVDLTIHQSTEEPLAISAASMALPFSKSAPNPTGERTNLPHHSSQYSSSSLSLGISTDLKKKIYQNEFVDFGTLLSSRTSQPSEYTIKISPNNPNSPLSLIPAQQPRKITSLELWMKAFLIFKSIHLEKHPQDALPLTTYEANIRQLSSHGANWHFYDEHFRLQRQSSLVPWDHFDSELWLRAHTGPNTFRKYQPSFRSGNHRFSATQLPKGYCWRYLQGQHCDMSQCHFHHECSQCGSKHQLSKCHGANRGRRSDPRPPQNQSGSHPATNQSK